MLNENDELVLKQIIERAPEGYKLFCAEDFFNKNAEDGINKLAEKGYIVLKYSNGGEYLLSLSNRGKQYFSSKYEKLLYKSSISRRVAIYSFLGAFLGGLLFAAISYMLRIYYG
ncbi:MAG: hypothetical protein IJA15_06885 [Clostridia bacterium]|nr:hypothetical protein [Clostridia bacterium]